MSSSKRVTSACFGIRQEEITNVAGTMGRDNAWRNHKFLENVSRCCKENNTLESHRQTVSQYDKEILGSLVTERAIHMVVDIDMPPGKPNQTKVTKVQHEQPGQGTASNGSTHYALANELPHPEACLSGMPIDQSK